ncbi:SusC/RagA family TonB-linked outer membrane protein [Carboxylicivirga taeanensis]|uniref:SusC/RagA family TonB-linked outer membrane protein n=1 Tax=Carboxylicivirga taeanensis TaxID=1416875 RepID=UPI003F6DDE81
MMRRIVTIAVAILISLSVRAQERLIEGIVVDKQDGSPIIGVNVLIKGTHQGTITDINGRFQINAAEDALIQVSFIGYQTQELKASTIMSDNKIYLQASVHNLDDVVVVAYGTQKKSDLTGAVANIKSADIAKIQSSRAENALEGKISGVIVTPSGQPGAAPAVFIRGFGSVNENSPIYVVDGMILYGIDHLNPSDIESISVLKDASAAALYGARGGNGVIMVTTKRGRSEDGNISINYNRGVQKVTHYPEMVSPAQYAQLMNELNGSVQYPNPQSLTGTNWFDEIFQAAPVQSLNVALSGGNDTRNYNLSVTGFEQEGVVKGDEYQRLTVLLNNNYKVKSWLNVGSNLQFAYFNTQGAPGGLIEAAYTTDPLMPVYNEDGTYGQSDNGNFANIAAKYEYEGQGKNQTYKTIGNAFAEVKLPFNLKFKSSFGIELSHIYGKSFTPEYFVSAWQKSDKSSVSVSNSRYINYSFENLLFYNKEIDKHKLDAMAGMSSYIGTGEWLSGGRRNLKGESEDFWYLDAGVVNELTDIWNGNSGNENRMLSYLFRFNYSFDSKYYLTATLRRDGSSRFGTNNKFGNFPSMAVGYRISDENFFEPLKPWVPYLKFRASWGVTGNDRIGDYAAYPGVNTGLDVVFGTGQQKQEGGTVTELTNTALRWEKHKQINFGYEAGFANNRLMMEVDYFKRTTEDMLLAGSILSHTGYTGVGMVNVGSVENSGYDLSISYRDKVGDFNYNWSVVSSVVDNKVIRLSNDDDVLWKGDLGNGRMATRTIVGESVGHFYGYVVDGIYQNEQEVADGPVLNGNSQPGDIRYKDFNNDGVINDEDKRIIGSPHPDFILGINLAASYKGFDFSASLSGQFGREIYNRKKAVRFANNNFESSYWNRWYGEGTSNSEPRVTNSGENYEVSDRFVEDGSYMRISDVSLGYTLPKHLTQKVHLNKVRVYATGSNLYTFTKYSGFDPIIGGHPTEAGIDRGAYPVPAIYSLGINLEF